jgi:uncharacterized membrane protein HdeD (DUF308 family)
MRKWTHPQGLVALLAGIYAALSPIWTTTPTENNAAYTMVTLGVLTAVAALFSLAMPDRVSFEGLIALLGVLFLLAPWVMDFTAFTALAWTAWIVGAVALVAGAADLQMTRTEHRGRGMATS